MKVKKLKVWQIIVIVLVAVFVFGALLRACGIMNKNESKKQSETTTAEEAKSHSGERFIESTLWKDVFLKNYKDCGLSVGYEDVIDKLSRLDVSIDAYGHDKALEDRQNGIYSGYSITLKDNKFSEEHVPFIHIYFTEYDEMDCIEYYDTGIPNIHSVIVDNKTYINSLNFVLNTTNLQTNKSKKDETEKIEEVERFIIDNFN